MSDEEEQQQKDTNVSSASIEKLSSLFMNSNIKNMKDSFDIISAICNENVRLYFNALLFERDRSFLVFLRNLSLMRSRRSSWIAQPRKFTRKSCIWSQ